MATVVDAEKNYSKEDLIDLLLLTTAMIPIVMLLKKTVHNKRRFWVRPTITERNRREKSIYHTLVRELRLQEPDYYHKYMRMSPEVFEELLKMVGPQISKKHTKMRRAISAAERLALTLRYLASGDSQISLAFDYRIGWSTTSGIIRETCDALWNCLKPEFLKPPTSAVEWQQLAIQFNDRWNFPHGIGALDGKHVVIQAPKNSGSQFYNYKGTFSIVLLAICDSDYCYTMVDIGNYGRISDGGVFTNSWFGQSLYQNKLNLPAPSQVTRHTPKIPYVLVADEAFPLHYNIMCPFPGRFLKLDKLIYNYRLSRARRTIENTFGITAARWRILRQPIIATTETVESIVKAVVCLHNYLKITQRRRLNNYQYCSIQMHDHDDGRGNIIEGEWRSIVAGDTGLQNIHHTNYNRQTEKAIEVREVLKRFFISNEGQVLWQFNSVGRTN